MAEDPTFAKAPVATFEKASVPTLGALPLKVTEASEVAPLANWLPMLVTPL